MQSSPDSRFAGGGPGASESDPDALAARWLELEAQFASHMYDGSSAQSPVGLIASEPRQDCPVIVSAPHATNHERAGTAKLADRGTGGLALLLAELTGCGAVASLSSAGGDANYDSRHPLKAWIEERSSSRSVVFDLHGFSSKYGVDVDLGTAGGQIPPGGLRAFAESLGEMSVTRDRVFAGSRPGTVTSWAQALGLRAVQVEISSRFRPPLGDHDDLARLVRGLALVIGSTIKAATLGDR